MAFVVEEERLLSAAMRSARLEHWFPELRTTEYEITSQKDDDYNCIAHAACDVEQKWWPRLEDFYWPPGMPDDDSVDSFAVTFCRWFGYEDCDNGDLEEGYEKLAIYAVGNHTKHMARQLPNGLWTSKLGRERDISHTLVGVEGEAYGRVARFLKRKLQPGS